MQTGISLPLIRFPPSAVKRTVLGGVRQCGYWVFLNEVLSGVAAANSSLLTLSSLPNLKSDHARSVFWYCLLGGSS
jgi:hypothetical protein